MIIKEVSVLNLSSPRHSPIQNSILTYERANLVLCKVKTQEGLEGLGFTSNPMACEIISGPLRKVLVGEDAWYVERLWERMFRSWRKPVHKSEVTEALSAVDIALWDLMGKETRKPLYKLLGGYTSEVEAYASGGFYQEGKGKRELVEEMRAYVEEGFRAVKMKVGRLSLEKDIERVRAVREALGDGIKLMLDANNAWEAYEAIRFAREAEKYDIYWLEEPVAPDDLEGSARVAASAEIPIASGENEYTRYGFRDLIESHGADIIQPDVAVCGGVSEWRKIAAMASAHHIPVAPHLFPYIHGHLVASISNGLIVEHFSKELDPISHNILKESPRTEGGKISLGKKPGLAIEIDESSLKKYI